MDEYRFEYEEDEKEREEREERELMRMLEGDFHSDVSYLIERIEKSQNVDWVEWFFKFMALYYTEKINGIYYKKEPFPTNQLLEMKEEVDYLLNHVDRHNPQIVLSLLVILNDYIQENPI